VKVEEKKKEKKKKEKGKTNRNNIYGLPDPPATQATVDKLTHEASMMEPIIRELEDMETLKWTDRKTKRPNIKLTDAMYRQLKDKLGDVNITKATSLETLRVKYAKKMRDLDFAQIQINQRRVFHEKQTQLVEKLLESDKKKQEALKMMATGKMPNFNFPTAPTTTPKKK
jgi:hypothetical protein